MARVGLVLAGNRISFSDYVSTSYYASINTDEIFIAKNINGYYMQVISHRIQDKSRGDSIDGLLFSFQINKSKTNYEFVAL